ncbi:alpha/beta fold hydrolase [Pontibacter harenae]|uniref:alpha/beta fold hydrolase n=1 Tax=Pontibacter harenae TaxID=2894083 RepID=UPI001E37E4C5|nr:alpha/beta hydrolase [Pontibacter harenae]MCC9169155.1 alpha/beta hydrolase [Pontibacter harenae]
MKRTTGAKEIKEIVHTSSGFVVSRDGLNIGYTKVGSGPAVIIVHGSYTVQNHWLRFATYLADTNTVYIYDRRGRGQSSDERKPFSFQHEVDDLAAMIDLAGPGATILGHSYGGGVTLSYIIQSGFEGRVIFYEPMNGILREVSQGLLPYLKSLVDTGRLDEATVMTQTRIVGFDPAAVEISKASPAWTALTEMTSVFLRELEALDNLNPTESETDAIRARTFLLLGTETQPEIRIATAALAARIRGITLYPVRNQGHLAHLLDPEQLKNLVMHCLTNSDI